MPIHPFPAPPPVEFDMALMQRYDGHGPRYATFPTADHFVEAFDAERYALGVQAANLLAHRKAQSVYVHLPFCQALCWFCACHTVITSDQSQADTYLDYLEREIALHHALHASPILVKQLYIGGGTPNFLSDVQLARLMDILEDAFEFTPDAERTIEIDPRSLGVDTLAILAQRGFRSIRLGVLDQDPQTQTASGRIQSMALTAQVVEQAHQLNYHSVGLNVIFGLPQQSRDSFGRTLEETLHWQPERVVLHRYTHQPHRRKSQRAIQADALPEPSDQLHMMQLAHALLSQAGYCYLGMDCFVRGNDKLLQAQRQGRLHWDVHGYSSHGDNDLLGLGLSAIGKVGACYSQNHRVLQDYYDALDHQQLPISRGLALNQDDLLRRSIILALLCRAEIAIEPIEITWMINFRDYFAAELIELEVFAQDGMIQIEKHRLSLLPRGRMLAKQVAMVFDRHRRAAMNAAKYSRVL